MVAETIPGNAVLEMQDPAPKPTQISRTKLAVTVILGTLVLGFIILCTVLLTGDPVPIQAGGTNAAQRRNIRGIELKELFEGSLSPSPFNGTFISGTEILFQTPHRDIVIYNAVTKTKEIILPGNHPSLKESAFYELSADRKFLMFAYTRHRLFRYSSIYNYNFVDLSSKAVTPLITSEGLRQHLLAVWAPVGNGIVFVSYNNYDIYYKPSVEEGAKRITFTGIPSIVYNGVPDWVNEEEVFGSNKALWFSPDGKKLAFVQYNDSLTRPMTMPYYGPPGSLDFQYTRPFTIRYPKPGTPNPVNTLFVADLESLAAPVELFPPVEVRGREPILQSVEWASNDLVLPIWLNRLQNESYVSLCSPTKLECRNILELKEPKGWITISPPKISPNGTTFAMILPQTQASGGQFRQVCLGEMGSNGEYKVRAITSGMITVTEILHFDAINHKIVYTAVDKETPEVQHIYEISTNEGSTTVCLTCDIRSKLHKKPCLHNTAVFSPDGIFALFCQGPGVPEITIRGRDNKKLLTWEDNRHIYDDVRSRQMPIVERLKVKVPGGHEAIVSLHLPPDIDRSGSIRYPLLINVYGGPDNFQANERFELDWNVYLTVNRSIVYATIDGRGSGHRGNDILFSLYRNLGSAEVEDQISVTKYIQNKYPFIDKKRTAIWGWSYGGYATTMALIKDKKKVFKCGIAVAPVTDWALYDTIYTERYMGLPNEHDNLLGYTAAQLNDPEKVENLRDKELYLIHGTLDDNVHYQQSMLLAKTLEQNDIMFRQQSYPDEGHGLMGVRPHLYHSMEKFLNDCFLPAN